MAVGYVYNKELKVIAKPYIDTYERFVWNTKLYYPDWNDDTMYVGMGDYTYPVYDPAINQVRQKTTKELKIEGLMSLNAGEYIDEGEVKYLEYDEALGYYKPLWDYEKKKWYEGTTRTEFLEIRTEKILEYSKLEENKGVLEKSKFTTEEEIAEIVEKMESLEQEINKIAKVLKTLGK